MYSFISDVLTDHVSCSHRTNTHSFKNFIEHNLKTVKSEEEKKELGDSDDDRPISKPASQKDKDESENEEASDKEERQVK